MRVDPLPLAGAPEPPWRDRRRRLTGWFGALGGMTSAVIGGVAFLLDRGPVAVMFGVMAALSGVVLLLVRQRRTGFAAQLACLLGSVATYSGIWLDSSGLGPAMLWFAVLPLVYAVLLSGRWFIAWTALNNVMALIFVVVVSWSLVERPAPTPAVARLLALTDVGLGLVWVGVMVGLTSKAVREAERRQAEAIARLEVEVVARRAAEAEARAAGQARAMFLATVSHEVRTPLNVILGLSEALGDSPLDPSQRRTVGSIRGAGELVVRLLNDTLDMGKVEAGGLQLCPEPTDLIALVEDMGSLLRHTPAAQHLNVFVRVDPEARGAWMADGQRLRQMVLNVGTNALKFTERGEIELGLRRDGDQLCFSVRDTGPGVPPEVVARLFRPYAQASADTHKRHGGTGLGLAIVKGLAELMGGAVGVDTEVGRGSTFWFSVPLERCAAAPAVEPPTAVVAPVRPAGDEGPRVLVVEDNPHNAQVIGAALRREGARVTLAEAGAEAITLCQSNDYELILLDAQLPDMDGPTVARVLRALPVRAAIVALTGEAGEEARRRSLTAGMDGHLVKPVSRAELGAALRRFTGPALAAR
jgi:signal transduction histidine kinase